MTTLIKSPQLSEAKRTLHSPSSLGSGKNGKNNAIDNYVIADHKTNGEKHLDKYLDMGDLAQVDEGKAEKQQSEIATLKESLRETLAELDELKKNLDDEKQKARERGYEDGANQAKDEISLQLNTRLQEFDAMLKSAREKLDESIENQQDKIVEIIITAIYKVFGELLVTKEGIQQVVKQVVKGVKQDQPIVVRISNEDFEIINELRSDLIKLQDSEIKIIADKQVGLGGCIVESASGSLDGRMEIQLQSLTNALLQAKGSSRRN